MDMFHETWSATLTLAYKALVAFMIIGGVAAVVYAWFYLPIMMDALGW